MRVGLVCPYDLGAPGGVQDQVVRLQRWLLAAGHEVKLIGPGDNPTLNFVSVGPTTVIPANGAATPVALSAAAARRVVEELETVDVAHIHEPLMPRVSLAAMRRSKVPLVGTFHADVSRMAGLVYRFGWPLIQRWLRRLDVITAVSPVAARVVDPTGRVRVIPNGVDVDEYGAAEKRPGSVAFLGRDDERKGLPVLIEAWPQIRAACPSAELTVIGADAPGGDVEGIHFAGRVTEPEKRRLLGEASVFCAPNLGGESFGIVVVEAMASECAVVASDLPGFVHVAAETARYVSPGDVAGIVRKVTSLLQDASAAEALGEAAKARSFRFGREEVAAAYLSAYEDALAAA
jgi:phosphatidylinositol alpha-mannosyltransferase